jgi:L-amino acid N-acyltransferase YncA
MEIIEITPTNWEQFPPTCFQKTSSPGYQIKQDWIKQRISEGLRIKAISDDGRIHGYIEYIDGAHAWRAVDAKDYLFIHCIWVHPTKNRNKGYASALIKEVIADAKNMAGVAVITGDKPFLAKKEIFLKNGFQMVETDGKYQLLALQAREGPMPKLNDYRKQLAKLKGWHIIYSKQCPWVAQFVAELDKTDITVTELASSRQAQDAPSVYAVFNLIHDGKLLADHYISKTRFNNILKKENEKLNKGK